MLADYLPILLMILISVIVAGGLLSLSSLLGPRSYAKDKLIPYESGIRPFGDARAKFSHKYYLIGALFILFDVEIVFLIAWAVVFKTIGIIAFIEILVFLIIILGGYFYVLKKGVLEWE